MPSHYLYTRHVAAARWSMGSKLRAIGHCVFMSSKLPLLNACIENTVYPHRPELQVRLHPHFLLALKCS